MLSTNRDVGVLIIKLRPFDAVNEYIYLSSAITTKNDVSLEIKRRICLTNMCYYDLNGQLSNKDLSRTTKLILYRTLILTVLLYGVEAWTLESIRKKNLTKDLQFSASWR